MREEPPVSDLITDELRSIRDNVPGVRGSITATSDGLPVAHDLPGLEPTQIAALVATMHAVAARASLSTQCGQVKEVITRGADGYLAVYAAGSAAIVGVLGLSDMNVAMLNLQARKSIDRIGEYSASLVRRQPASAVVPPAAPCTARAPAAPAPAASRTVGRQRPPLGGGTRTARRCRRAARPGMAPLAAVAPLTTGEWRPAHRLAAGA